MNIQEFLKSEGADTCIEYKGRILFWDDDSNPWVIGKKLRGGVALILMQTTVEEIAVEHLKGEESTWGVNIHQMGGTNESKTN